MNDPYKTLGVSRTADQAEIKSAYRKLAKKYHPDLNPGDTDVERRFKDVSAAYDVLGDSAKRAKYDRGEIDTGGRERPGAGAGFWRNWSRRGAGSAGADTSGGTRTRFDFGEDFESESDPIDEILKAWRSSKTNQGSGDPAGAGPGTRSATRRSPQDQRYRLKVPFVEAVGGIKKRVTLSDGKIINLTIPAGTEDGAILRLKGQGKPASSGKPAGDAYLELQVEAHAFYRRDGQDIHIDLPVTLKEAVLGASVTVPTIHGNVSLKVPKGANTGQQLRLRGKGVPDAGSTPAGDQYVTLSVMLPSEPDPALEAFVESWKPAGSGNPRHKMGV
ncbi:DnaJ C-terminal domain-containing protein [Thalassobaculum sp.]|uniref:DnaJ C-terminal domain-containing protein n=1 Tax=Thalassobaculum sp. TaxID=2022740 RepID=UPI0032EF483F